VSKLPRLPRRPRDAHKGVFGRVLVVAGSPGMTGAGCLAALAAQRAGAGLVTLAVPAALHAVVETKLTSAMTRALPDDDDRIGKAAADAVLSWQAEFDVVAIGPGVGTAPQTVQAVRRLVAELAVPKVIDADALNALAGATHLLGPGCILTPHPGEMARLLGAENAANVQRDRRATAVAFAAEHNVLLALKGAGTIVTDGRRTAVNETGNPGMAAGGTGDVLTGTVAGLLCQAPLTAWEALRLAVHVHGLAGDIAADAVGELSVMAEDVLDALPRALMQVRE
jgi:ADP-dependent NAD(P)H-hydrate dehydratase / NAD(P)H-hydrate epimerase